MNTNIPFGGSATSAAFSGSTQPPPSATISDIFHGPSNPKVSSEAKGEERDKPDVYYLVFLGVLVGLIVIAGALTYRSYRQRRQYRTAAQMAIARGDLRWWGTQQATEDDLWNLGVFTRGPRPGPDWAAIGGGRLPNGHRRQRRWVKIPVLWEAEGEEETPEDKEWEEADGEEGWPGQPLTLHSLLSEPTPVRPETLPPAPTAPTPSHFDIIARALRRTEHTPAPPPPAPAAPRREREIDRARQAAEDGGLAPGEPVRVAVIVQMPGYPSVLEVDVDEEDELPGWRPGMELGVWEGTITTQGLSSSNVASRSSSGWGRQTPTSGAGLNTPTSRS